MGPRSQRFDRSRANLRRGLHVHVRPVRLDLPHQYHPATDAIVLLVGFYLSLAYWLGIVELTRSGNRYLPWGLWVVLAGLVYSRDGLLLSYPLLVGLICCRSTAWWTESRRTSRLVIAYLFSSFGLLPLIKVSGSVMCGLIGLITCVQFARHRRFDLVASAIGAAAGTMAVFWVIAGQPLLALPTYLMHSLPLVFGYADVMALPGDTTEIIGYLVVLHCSAPRRCGRSLAFADRAGSCSPWSSPSCSRCSRRASCVTSASIC